MPNHAWRAPGPPIDRAGVMISASLLCPVSPGIPPTSAAALIPSDQSFRMPGISMTCRGTCQKDVRTRLPFFPGGSHADDNASCRPAARKGIEQSLALNIFGLRVVLAQTAPQLAKTPPPDERISTLPPKATGLERDVYVASSFERPSANVSPTPIARGSGLKAARRGQCVDAPPPDPAGLYLLTLRGALC